MDNFSITQFGKPLDESLYTIDIENKLFSTAEDSLILNFEDLHHWVFISSGDCIFKTGNGCVFKINGGHCTFKTGWECTFDTDWHCTFDTGENCIFHTSNSCTFDTCSSCIFSIDDIESCKFKSYDGVSIVLDRDDNKRYVLTKEFAQLRKIANG